MQVDDEPGIAVLPRTDPLPQPTREQQMLNAALAPRTVPYEKAAASGAQGGHCQPAAGNCPTEPYRHAGFTMPRRRLPGLLAAAAIALGLALAAVSSFDGEHTLNASLRAILAAIS